MLCGEWVWRTSIPLVVHGLAGSNSVQDYKEKSWLFWEMCDSPVCCKLPELHAADPWRNDNTIQSRIIYRHPLWMSICCLSLSLEVCLDERCHKVVIKNSHHLLTSYFLKNILTALFYFPTNQPTNKNIMYIYIFHWIFKYSLNVPEIGITACLFNV